MSSQLWSAKDAARERRDGMSISLPAPLSPLERNGSIETWLGESTEMRMNKTNGTQIAWRQVLQNLELDVLID